MVVILYFSDLRRGEKREMSFMLYCLGGVQCKYCTCLMCHGEIFLFCLYKSKKKKSCFLVACCYRTKNLMSRKGAQKGILHLFGEMLYLSSARS